MCVNTKPDLRADLAKLIKRRKRDRYLIADAADIYDDRIEVFLKKFAG